MKTKRDAGTIQYGSDVLLKHTRSVKQEMDGVRLAVDIECVHRMRVASRRLRTAFDLFPICLPARRYPGWLKQVKKITRALGAARDSDVQIERLEQFLAELPSPGYASGIRRLLLRLRQRRQRSQIKVIAALDSLEKTRLLDDLITFLEKRLPLPPDPEAPQLPLPSSPALFRHAYQSIHDHLEEFLSYNEVVHQPEAVAELHAMRIAAKRLRYTLEAFAPLYPDELKPYLAILRSVQEALGDIHDCDVWAQFLPGFLSDERQRALEYSGSTRNATRYAAGLHFFEQDRKVARDATYLAFQQDWQTYATQRIWDDLARAIQPPLPGLHSSEPDLSASIETV